MPFDYLCTWWEWVIACIWEWCLKCVTALIRYPYKVIILLRIIWSNGHVRIPCCQIFDLVTLVPNSCSYSLLLVLRSKLFAFFVRAISALVTYVVDISVALDLFNIPCVGSFVGYVEHTHLNDNLWRSEITKAGSLTMTLAKKIDELVFINTNL